MRKPIPLLAAAALMTGVFGAATAAQAEGQTSEYINAEDAWAARALMADKFGKAELKPGQFVWDEGAQINSGTRILISLSAQMAYVFNGSDLIAASTISSGTTGHETPTGVFPILEKRPMYRSKKYDNAPMPFMQRINEYGVAMHAGRTPGYPASHGCIRLPSKFAQKLYKVTEVGTTVVIQG